MPVGDNNLIHGYNALYRAETGNFHSFETVKKGSRGDVPSSFIFQPIKDTAGVLLISGGGVTDHQGHIVPQNMLTTAIETAQTQLREANTAGTLATFLTANAWMNAVVAYGTAIHAASFDLATIGIDDWLENFASIIMWNPINICRAPEDNKRLNVPGNTIDTKVHAYIKAALTHNTAWMTALDALIANTVTPVPATLVTAYVAACSNTLAGQLTAGAGYYSFPWKNNGTPTSINLVPA
jgi:hypothetical protein